MIHVQGIHPFEAITAFVIRWIECLVRGDYAAADALIDKFESNARIGDYFEIEDDDGPMQAVDPRDDEWWQISFNSSGVLDKSILVEAYVPLARGYRPLNACFVLVPIAGGFDVVFQYCKPS
jgi:hypothetical protein